MNHEAAVHLIPDMMHGRLRDETQRDLLVHVGSCKECRSLSETYVLMSDVLTGDYEGIDEHPSSLALVDYAVDESRLEVDERDSIAAHVMDCSTCASDVEATTVAEAEQMHATTSASEVAGTSRSSAARASYLAASLAATVVLAVLAYPTYLGLFEVPRIKDRIVSLESGRVLAAPQGWIGVVEQPVLLRDTLRSSTAKLPLVEIVEGQPYVTVSLDPGGLDAYADTERLRIEIRGPKGETVGELRLSEAELRTRVSQSGAITFMLPAAGLADGIMTLSIHADTEPTDPLFETRYRVNRI